MKRRNHGRVVPALLASLLAAPLHAQQVLFEAHGAKAFDYLGSSAAVGPDLDGDGFADFAVGASGLHKGGTPTGGVLILSGRDFSVIRTIFGLQYGEAAGFALAWCGDVDGDGVDDLAVGAPAHDGVGRGSGLVRIHSGATGNLIREIPGATARGVFGWALSNLGDTNGDGIDDLLVGAPRDPTHGTWAGLVVICSGADGSTLQTFPGAAGSEFGWSVANVGDLDGDGVDDFAAGAPTASGAHVGDRAGTVHVHSGATGALLFKIDGGDAKCFPYSGTSFSYVGDNLGTATGPAGDFDGDGVQDVWAASLTSAITSGSCHGVAYLTVVSGATGAALFKVDTKSAGQWYANAIGDVDGDGRTDFISYGEFAGVYVLSTLNGQVIWENDAPQNADLGNALVPAGDVNGDGRPDLLVGAQLGDVGGTNTGTIEVIATNDLWLDVSPTHLPRSGWALTFRANLGPPGNPAVLVLTAVNGVPRFDVVAVSAFDSSGSALLASGTVPSGFSGTTISLRALAIDAAGRIVDSIDEVLTLP